MQLTSVLIALLATTVTAKMHNLLHCYTYERSPLGAGTLVLRPEDPATTAACNAYRQRNTGNEIWDTCPDCTVVNGPNGKGCSSASTHMGGDEFNL